ncbi:MAG TPA: ATP-binding cassette domain-containing protein [Longimicrobiales bacterium]|nr:ATP-binding cassette domain-containing protein [Longimicrobiales bacterium]
MLKAEGLGRRVDGRWIWRSLDLAVEPGERVALVGPSGSGKTLLLRALAALDALDEGRILLDGRLLEEWPVPRYRARVSYVPQRTTLAEGTVEANLRLPFDFQVHAGRAWDRERALELLEALDRGEGFLHKRSEDLSGGEEQIVALVRNLLVDPGILLLDEPAASMDADLARRAEGLVETWREEDARRAVVWTSHQVDRVARVADRRVEL